MRDRCVNPDIDAAIGMAEDSTTAARPPWTIAPILFRWHLSGSPWTRASNLFLSPGSIISY